jgi:hypothetical protein
MARYSITSSAHASTDGHVELKRLGGLEGYHQLILRRRLHRQFGRFLAVQMQST